jgi:anti-sigma factor RsiW
MTDTHLDPEILASLADRAVVPERGVSDHLADCARCAADVADLQGLRAALATLPDISPSRPLRLLPAVPEPARRAGLTGWRRLLAPVAVAGFALAVVGGAGTLLQQGALGSAAGLDNGITEVAASQDLAAPGVPSVETASPGDRGGEVGGQDGGVNPTAVDTYAPFPWALVAIIGFGVFLTATILGFVIRPRAG